MSYTDTFIPVAEDSEATKSTEPNLHHGKKTIAGHEYDLLRERPYTYDQDELIFEVYVRRNDIPAEQVWENRSKIWTEAFSKSHSDLRSSALIKRYGWGAHFNADGKIALYGIETEEYERFIELEHIKVLTPLGSKRK